MLGVTDTAMSGVQVNQLSKGNGMESPIVEFVGKQKGAFMVYLYTVTAPKLNKGGRGELPPNPYYGNVVHEAGQTVVFGSSYQNVVNNRWQEVGFTAESFVAEGLWKGFGERVNAYTARHKTTGAIYLVAHLRTDADGHPLPKVHDQYRLADSGELISKETLSTWFPAKSPSKAQRVEELDSREVHPRTFHIDNGTLGKFKLGVSRLHCNGEIVLA